MDVTANVPYQYDFSLASSPHFGLKNMTVKFFINGTSIEGTHYPNYIEGTSQLEGNVSFLWPAPNGTYSIRGLFEGDSTYKPSEVYVTVTATTRPLAVLFSVSPSVLEPGSSVLLNVTYWLVV